MLAGWRPGGLGQNARQPVIPCGNGLDALLRNLYWMLAGWRPGGLGQNARQPVIPCGTGLDAF